MHNKIKNMYKVCILPICLLIGCMFMMNIHATSEDVGSSQSEIDKGIVWKGEEINYTFSLTDYTGVSYGINAVKGTLVYDEDVFGSITADNFTMLNDWESFFYNPETKEFIAIKKVGGIEPEAVFTLTLTTLKDVAASSTYIGVTDVVTSQGIEDIYPQDSGATIGVVSSVQDTTNTEDEDTTTLESVETGDHTITSLYVAAFFVSVVLLLVVVAKLRLGKYGYVFANDGYVRKGYRKLNHYVSKNKAGVIFGLVVVCSFGAVTQMYAYTKKGELNGDGTINYADVVLLEKHLISLSELPEDKQSLADMNGDGKLTVTDLSMLIRRVENTMIYQVSLQSAMDTYHYEKNEEVLLKFSATISNEGKIASVTVNKETYEVSEDESNVYTVTLPKEQEAGMKSYRITQVTLTNGKTVSVDYTEKVDILKDSVSLVDFEAEEDTKTAQMNVSYNIVDKDNAFTSASWTLVNVETEEEEDAGTIEKAGEQTLTLTLDDEDTYALYISVTYRRDHEEISVEEDEYTETLTMAKELKLNIDYQFTFSEMKIYSEEMKEIQEVSKNESFRIGFQASNATDYTYATAIVNGVSYEVSVQDGIYYVELPAYTQEGTQEITLEALVLENGKKFTLSENNTVSVYVSKQVATLENAVIEETEDSIQVSFSVNDPDSTLSNQKIVIKDAEGKEVFTKTFSGNSVNESFSLENTLTTSYTVEVIADSTLGGDTQKDEKEKVLLTKTIEAKPRVIVESASIDKTYVEKGNTVELTYTLKKNVEEEITQLVVNNQALDVSVSGNAYTVTYEVQETAGVQELVLSQVVAGTNKINVTSTQSVEVLKSAPTVSDYTVEDDFTNSTVTVNFTVNDEESAFVSGVIRLYDASGSVVQEKTFTEAGEQSVVFSVTEKASYTARVYVSYAKASDGTQTVADEEVLEKPVQLINDYEVKLSDIKTLTEEQKETSNFEKSEQIVVSFTGTSASVYDYEKVVVNEETYTVTKTAENQYTFTMEGMAEAGEKEFTISKVIFENGKEESVSTDNTFKVEVLKDIPSVESFTGGKNTSNQLEATFTLKDEDQAITAVTSILSDSTGKELAKDTTTSGNITLVGELTDSELYRVKVTVTYQRDTKGTVTDSFTFEQEVSASRDAIELKEITDITLYQTSSSGTSEVTMLDITNGVPTDIENYYAVVTSDTLPQLYSGITEFRYSKEESKLEVVLSQEDLIQYTSDGGKTTEYTFEIPYKDASGEHYVVTKADEFFQQIANNLSGSYELTEDLDASNISSSSAAILGSFKGTLNGNGYKILNLPTAMFETIDGGTIKNLIIEDANVTTSVKGIVANTIKGASTIENVFIVDSVLSNGQGQVGGIAGLLNGTSVIKESAVINVSIKASNTIGGIAGQSNANTKIENSYVTGTLTATQYGNNLGARVGGISGWHNGTIDTCFTKVTISNTSSKGNGGLIGGPNSASPTIKNSLAITTGNAYRIAGFDVLSNASNVYEYSGTDATTNINDNNNTKVLSVDDLTDVDFFKTTLGFNETVWNLDLVSSGKLPSLQEDPVAKELKDYEIEDNENGIANYEEVRSHGQYEAEREIAYYNMSKLMPFADTSIWVEKGNQIATDSNLYKQKIVYVLPMTANDELVSGVREDTVAEVSKIRIVYENDKVEDKEISYTSTLGSIVANYEMKDSTCSYQFPKYIGSIDETWLNEIVTKATAYSYDDIAALTTEEESRLYRDYYTESVQTNIKNILLNLLLSQGEYPTYFNNSVVKSEWQSTFTDEDNLKELLYAYNYYDKWYHFDFSGIKLSELMFFNGNIFSSKMTAQQLISDLLNTSETNRGVGKSYAYYTNVLKSYTGQEMMDFIGDLGVTIGGYETPSDWFAADFEGLLLEQDIANDNIDVKYRIWDIMSGMNDKNLVLPILSAPQEDMYLISLPTQLMIGSLNGYTAYHQENGREVMYERMVETGRRAAIIYGTSANWIPNAEEILNSFVNIQYDSVRTFPESDGIVAGTQEYGTTNDPVIKWVYEACVQYQASNAGGAVANGYNVYWLLGRALDVSHYITYLFSHETAHNQDGKYYYNGYGRRDYTGAESHADGNLTQQVKDGLMAFNIVYDQSATTDVVNNFSYERIETEEDLQSFYEGLFETQYVLDYLAAQAFLQLTPEQQSKVAVQAREEGTTSLTTYYDELDASAFEAMNLTDMESLWDNKIVWKESVTKAASASSGEYKNDSFYDMTWYQPHNDNGSPDNLSFARLGQEMLGLKGYVNGYLKYVSNYVKVLDPTIDHLTDLIVLRSIMEDDTITWKEYKLNRYKDVAANLSKITYFDTQEVIEQFKQAFINDGTNGTKTNVTQVKRLWYGVVKRATNDFETGSIYDEDAVVVVNSAQELIDAINSNEMGHYKLGSDIDFSNISAEDGAYITNTFLGVLDGNGHTLTNVHYTLFADAQYAYITNLTIDSPIYYSGSTSYIATYARNVELKNINVKNADAQLPVVKSTEGAYYEIDVDVDAKAIEVGTVDEFLSVLSDDVGLQKKITLTADLDFSGKDYTTALNVISGTFKGELDGQGHTIKGLTGVLFEAMQDAKVINLVIEGSTLTSDSQYGTLANTDTNSTITNIKVVDATLKGSAAKGYTKGGLIGTAKETTFDTITVENITIEASRELGGIAGAFINGTVKNAVVTGSINGLYYNTGTGNTAGGIAGKVSGSTIENVFTNVILKASYDWYIGSKGTGGIIGGPTGTSVTIKNSVSASDIGNVKNPAGYRIAGFDVLSNSTNVYELSTSNAITNITDANKDQIKSVDSDRLKTKEFYTTDLGWSEEIWDFSEITTTGIPKLK